MNDTDIVSVLLARAASGDKESAEAAAEIVRLREMIERRGRQQKRLGVESSREAARWKAISPKMRVDTRGLPFHEKVKARSVVDEATGCWVWQGACGINGYGTLRRGPGGKPAYCHRIMYGHAHGEVPEGMVVMHTCDNRRCVNPEHLVAGTQKDNIQDMHKKGRCTRSILTAAEVQEIRVLKESGMTFHALSTRFSVSQQTVLNIINGKAWKWVV